MSIVLDKNLKLLSEHQPFLYEKIKLFYDNKIFSKTDDISKILLAKQNDIIINMLIQKDGQDYLLCDHENPINEAKKWIDTYIDPANKAEIVFGMGFGYHIEILIKSFENKKVLIIEPNIEIFCHVLKIRNLEFIIKNTTIYVEEPIEFVLGKIYKLLWDTRKGDIQLEPFWVYANMYADMWDELKYKFLQQAENFVSDIVTRRTYGKIWTENYIMNMRKISCASDASGLYGKFDGIPAILVSAGPSLNKNMHLLKEIQNKCIIMAAGTAAKILIQNNINPHFMVGIDANETEARIHQSINNDNVYLIFSNQISQGSLSYKGPKFLMDYSEDYYTHNYFKYCKRETILYSTGPSVANTAFDILYKMGCNKIILIGQDLAYTDSKLYADNELSLMDNNIIDIKRTEKEPIDKELIPVVDIHGNKVYTKPAFITMKNWFELCFENIHKNSKDKIDIINATEGGLNIRHARNMTLSDALGTIEFTSPNILHIIKEVHNKFKFEESIEAVKNYENEYITDIKAIRENCIKQLENLDLLERGVYHPTRSKKAYGRLISAIEKNSVDVLDSRLYNTLLKNLIFSEYYTLKAVLENQINDKSDYEQIRDIYVNVIKGQIGILKDSLSYVEELLQR
jgi:hypothetical protein